MEILINYSKLRKFKEGDNVYFVDKYGIKVVGKFKEYKMVPGFDKRTNEIFEIETCIVEAEAFQAEQLIDCSVPEHSLRFVKNGGNK